MKSRSVILGSMALLCLVICGFSIAAYAPPSTNIQPLVAYSYTVEIAGVGEANFMEVDGLSVAVDAIEYREGADEAIMLIPGETHYGPLVLKNGLTTSTELLDWAKGVADGTAYDVTGALAKTSLSIIVRSKNGVELARYNCYECWPSGWSLGKLTSTDGSVAFEELVIQYEYFELAD